LIRALRETLRVQRNALRDWDVLGVDKKKGATRVSPLNKRVASPAGFEPTLSRFVSGMSWISLRDVIVAC